MSEAPERIWARTTRIACGSWDDYRMVESRLWSPYSGEGSVEYVRADRIKELETKLDHAELHLRRLVYLQSGGVITGTQSERWLRQALDFLAALVGVNNDKGDKDG